jgi:hypothetical protein
MRVVDCWFYLYNSTMHIPCTNCKYHSKDATNIKIDETCPHRILQSLALMSVSRWVGRLEQGQAFLWSLVSPCCFINRSLVITDFNISLITLEMLFSLRRVFRTKSSLESKTERKPISEPSPNPVTRKRTTYFYSGIHTLHSSEHDKVEWVFILVECHLSSNRFIVVSYLFMDSKEIVSKPGNVKTRRSHGLKRSFHLNWELLEFWLTLMIRLSPVKKMPLPRTESQIMHKIY